MRFTKRSIAKGTTAERTYSSAGAVIVQPSQPIDLSDIYNRLDAIEARLRQINPDTYLSKAQSDETPYTLTARRYVADIYEGRDWQNSSNGIRVYDDTVNGGQATLNIRNVEKADSQTTAPFPTVYESFAWSGLEYNKPKLFTFTVTNDVNNLNITHEDAEMVFYSEFISTDNRVSVESVTVTYTVDAANEQTITPDGTLCYMPLTTGTHDYHITATYQVSVIMRTGQSIPSYPHIKLYGTDEANEQTTVTWVNSTMIKHVQITPNHLQVKNNNDGYMLTANGLFKITGNTTEKLI